MGAAAPFMDAPRSACGGVRILVLPLATDRSDTRWPRPFRCQARAGLFAAIRDLLSYQDTTPGVPTRSPSWRPRLPEAPPTGLYRSRAALLSIPSDPSAPTLRCWNVAHPARIVRGSDNGHLRNGRWPRPRIYGQLAPRPDRRSGPAAEIRPASITPFATQLDHAVSRRLITARPGLLLVRRPFAGGLSREMSPRRIDMIQPWVRACTTGCALSKGGKRDREY